MVAAANLVEVAALVGDTARATMLSALMGGQSLTATELAYCANVSRSTASGHLSKLDQPHLVGRSTAADAGPVLEFGRIKWKLADRREAARHGLAPRAYPPWCAHRGRAKNAGARPMKRNVGGFDIDWIGDDRIELTRNNPPRHRYQFETSPDRRRVKRLLLTLPEDVAEGDPLLDADRCEEEARKAAGEFLEQQNRQVG